MNIAIYMEGGGHSRDSKAALRQGMEEFLSEIKNACRRKSWSWKLTCCGGRNETYKRFENERAKYNADIVVLLVDSEAPVVKEPADHLATREKKWDFQGVDGNMVHLMAQTMETWIVADPDALKNYYGQGFQANALPRHQNLEEVGKSDIEQALEQATQQTQKKKYHKIKHARVLLERINPMTVREKCPHCEWLFKTLLRLIDST